MLPWLGGVRDSDEWCVARGSVSPSRCVAAHVSRIGNIPITLQIRRFVAAAHVST